jgi:hypothetical protein
MNRISAWSMLCGSEMRSAYRTIPIYSIFPCYIDPDGVLEKSQGGEGVFSGLPPSPPFLLIVYYFAICVYTKHVHLILIVATSGMTLEFLLSKEMLDILCPLLAVFSSF